VTSEDAPTVTFVTGVLVSTTLFGSVNM
jgi:hypothetical protein